MDLKSENKKKIIIEIHGDIDELTAFEMVHSVMMDGKVSVGAKGKKHYCWLSVFENGNNIAVAPKYNNDNEKFIVYENKRKIKKT